MTPDTDTVSLKGRCAENLAYKGVFQVDDNTHVFSDIYHKYDILNMHIVCMNLHWTFDGTAEGETCTASDLFPFVRPRNCLRSNRVVWDVKLPSNFCMDIKYKLVSM